MRDAYAKMQEAYNDLSTADQKSMKLRYAAFFGCLIASLMCMGLPAIGFAVSWIMPYHLRWTRNSLPLAPPTVYLVCNSYSTGSQEVHDHSDCHHHL